MKKVIAVNEVRQSYHEDILKKNNYKQLKIVALATQTKTSSLDVIKWIEEQLGWHNTF